MDHPRIAPGGLKDIGLVNYGFSTLAGRVIGGTKPNIFTTLGRQRRLFRGWLYYSSKLMPGGRLPRRESELVILRIATIRECEYERRHHVRLGRRAGVTPAQIDHVVDETWSGWSARERTLFAAADQFVDDKFIDDPTWASLSEHLDEPELIEFLLLCGQYDSLATVLLTLRVQPEDQSRPDNMLATRNASSRLWARLSRGSHKVS